MPPLPQRAHLSWQVGTVDHMVHSCFKIPDDFSSLEAYIALSSTGKAGQQGGSFELSSAWLLYVLQPMYVVLSSSGGQPRATGCRLYCLGVFGASMTNNSEGGIPHLKWDFCLIM